MAVLFDKPIWRVVGDTAVIVEFGDSISPEINRRVRVMTMALDREEPHGMVEVIPAYRSLMIVYDPLQIDLPRLRTLLDRLERQMDEAEVQPRRLVEIPVLYGGEYGPDIEMVAVTHELTVEQVISIHSGTLYLVYMIGFTPGFAYLGGLPEALHTPRLATPRPRVAAGSVGIANDQTGIYPLESPGGWRLIGRTPLRLFDPSRKDPFLYQAGDLIRFKSISADEYDRISQGEAC